LTNTLSPAGYPGHILSSELVQQYKDNFIHVENYNRFQESDIVLNNVSLAGSAPEFVADYERKLDSKPSLAGDVRQFLELSPASPADHPQVCYFVYCLSALLF
jgi:hypothetical protein